MSKTRSQPGFAAAAALRHLERVHKVTLARNAMKTRFELVLAGSDSSRLRAAGEEALDEIQRIERVLNLYDNGSEIAQINARAAADLVRISPEVFGLLERAREYSRLTGGAFDPTAGPLIRCWGFMRGSGARPDDEAIAEARRLAGFDHLVLDSSDCSVRFLSPGMMLDLGSIGKGYGLDCAAGILREAGVENALLHGGTSTIVALGDEPEGEGWKVAVENPRAAGTEAGVLSVIQLKDESLSVSAVWGKSFQLEGRTYGHVLDPRTGWPAEHALLGAAILPEAAATDALSTAVLLASAADLDELKRKIPGLRFLQLPADGAGGLIAHGIQVDKSLDSPRPPSV